MKQFLRRALFWLIATGVFSVCVPAPALAQAGGDITGDLTTLSMTKTHDESCDVLDSRARTQFRNAVYAWVRSLNVDEAMKTRIWKLWDGRGSDPSHDCAGSAFLAIVLWPFRDSRGEDPQAQFRFLSKAKSYELKCHVLPTTGLQAFYQAGLRWIGTSGGSAQERSAMTQEWQKSTGSEDADCDKDHVLDFMVTWTFLAPVTSTR